ncbi:MAG: AhpC/TSA family protein [Chitinophagaceae bacterium]|nr:AhpC/TSA family protein [Chitinophagaceae bacterium]
MKNIVQLIIIILCSTSLAAQEYPNGLQVNDEAPAFSAVDQNGTLIELKDVLTKGNVVMIFYRGQWCPHCNRQLKALEDSLQYFVSKKAQLIAITPEKPDNITKSIFKTKASFPILYDDGLKIMKSYKVDFAVDEKTIVKYKNYGIDFNEANGSNGANLPVPAVYIINQEGKIIYKYFDIDYKKRPSVAELLKHL